MNDDALRTAELAEPTPGPAAHSMDTTWFAVDALGHVGVFESGEGGGVPNAHFDSWRAQSSDHDLYELLLAQPAAVGIRYEATGLFEPDTRTDPDEWDTYAIIESPDQLPTRGRGTLVELSDPAAAADPRLLAAVAGFDRLRRLPGERVLVRAYLDLSVLARLWHELGIERVRTNYELEAERFGLYFYVCDDYSAGPYQRRALPQGAALRVEQLSAEARRRLAPVNFARLDFSRAAEVQPFEHMPSSAWSDEWLGTDGQMHPVE